MLRGSGTGHGYLSFVILYMNKKLVCIHEYDAAQRILLVRRLGLCTDTSSSNVTTKPNRPPLAIVFGQDCERLVCLTHPVRAPVYKPLPSPFNIG